MKSWWDLTEEQQKERLAIEPLTIGGVQETFRHPASYAELRLAQTVYKYADEANKLRAERDRAVGLLRKYHACPIDMPQAHFEQTQHEIDALLLALEEVPK